MRTPWFESVPLAVSTASTYTSVHARRTQGRPQDEPHSTPLCAVTCTRTGGIISRRKGLNALSIIVLFEPYAITKSFTRWRRGGFVACCR